LASTPIATHSPYIFLPESKLSSLLKMLVVHTFGQHSYNKIAPGGTMSGTGWENRFVWVGRSWLTTKWKSTMARMKKTEKLQNSTKLLLSKRKNDKIKKRKKKIKKRKKIKRINLSWTIE